MRKIRKFLEKIIEGILTLSGAATTLVIILISIFLFKEGFGLFNSPVVEKGYMICLNSDNPVQQLSSFEIKEILDKNSKKGR